MPATDLCHPIKDRPLSVQEYKRIQEFPDNWILCGDIKAKYKQVGNAVPVSLGEAIGKHIKKLLEGKKIKELDEFHYSRYVNTDIDSFKKIVMKKTEMVRQLGLRF